MLEVLLSSNTVQWLWVTLWLILILGGTIMFMGIVLYYAYGGQSYPGPGSIPPPKVPPERHPSLPPKVKPGYIEKGIGLPTDDKDQ